MHSLIPRLQYLSRVYPEIPILGACALCLWLVFDATTLDLVIAGFVNETDSPLGWPGVNSGLMQWFNEHFIKWLTACGFLLGLGWLLYSCSPTATVLSRRIGVFLILSLLIGPGLIVNGGFKNLWGRPRPADTVQFGGNHEFRKPMQPGRGGAPEAGGAGRSFPSGHAAAAFWLSALFFVARIQWRRHALTVLSSTVLIGLIVGLARVLAGRHYPSDVLWAGMIVFSINWVLAYLVVKLPRYPTSA